MKRKREEKQEMRRIEEKGGKEEDKKRIKRYFSSAHKIYQKKDNDSTSIKSLDNVDFIFSFFPK